jgi:hypothetical protein
MCQNLFGQPLHDKSPVRNISDFLTVFNLQPPRGRTVFSRQGKAFPTALVAAARNHRGSALERESSLDIV